VAPSVSGGLTNGGAICLSHDRPSGTNPAAARQVGGTSALAVATIDGWIRAQIARAGARQQAAGPGTSELREDPTEALAYAVAGLDNGDSRRDAVSRSRRGQRPRVRGLVFPGHFDIGYLNFSPEGSGLADRGVCGVAIYSGDGLPGRPERSSRRRSTSSRGPFAPTATGSSSPRVFDRTLVRVWSFREPESRRSSCRA